MPWAVGPPGLARADERASTRCVRKRSRSELAALAIVVLGCGSQAEPPAGGDASEERTSAPAPRDDAQPAIDAETVAGETVAGDCGSPAGDGVAIPEADVADTEASAAEVAEATDAPTDADPDVVDSCAQVCDGVCARPDDPQTGCGVGCSPCPAVAGAVATCEAKGCGHVCLLDHVPCEGGCCPRTKTPSFDAGHEFTCALDPEGIARCWGSNFGGVVSAGVGPVVKRGEIRVIAGLPKARKLVTGSNHACTLSVDGRVHCWGMAWKDPADRTVRPVAIGPAVDLFAIGRATCALSAFGDLNCWGPLDGSHVEPPQLVERGVLGAVVASGYRCTLGVRGDLRCQGRNEYGQVGVPPVYVSATVTPWVRTPQTPPGLERGVTAITSTVLTTCAIALGSTRCWGHNNIGQLGVAGDTTDRSEPKPIDGPSDFVALDSGSAYFCGLTRAATAVCWGYRERPETRHPPKALLGLEGVRAIAVGTDHVCARRDDGLWCLGNNGRGQLGSAGPETETPRKAAVP